MLSIAVALAGCSGDDDSRSGAEMFFADHASAIYELDEHWMCKRGLVDDVCDNDIDAMVVEADGTLTVEPHVVASNPRFDCLYIYPTVRLGDEGNAAFDGMYDEEIFTTRNQAARFGRVCEMYAPLYRQRTLTAASDPAFTAIAYGDVVDAFKYYMGNLNQGRPFVLMGHSQGAGHLRRLVAEEIDPIAGLVDRMISVLILGSAVAVPIGEDVGGSFQNVPACRSRDQFNCVISYASFRDTVPPPENSFFGRVSGEGLQALCTNPADLTGGAGVLDPYFNIRDSSQFAIANPDLAWAGDVVDPPRIDTPFVALPGLVTSECISDGEFSYLQLTVNPDPGPRVDDIGGDLTPEWGMHLIDANVAMGNLVDIVESQAQAWDAAH